MSLIIAVLSLLFTTPDDVEALRSTAPAYLTTETARIHLSAARIAAHVYNVDPDLLLAVAHHESRYNATARTPEPLNKTSCGVMTPIPKQTCVTPDLVDGYLEGAAHLREWLDATGGDERLALIGFAGGYKLLRACAAGPVLQQRLGRNFDICTVPRVFQYRARMIQRTRIRGRLS